MRVGSLLALNSQRSVKPCNIITFTKIAGSLAAVAGGSEQGLWQVASGVLVQVPDELKAIIIVIPRAAEFKMAQKSPRAVRRRHRTL